jgi:protein-tyrosine phosphatase
LIDLHIHLLPAVDDGPDGIDAALALAQAEVDEGVTAVAVTPHVSENYPTTAQQMFTALSGLRAAVAAAGIELDVRGGAEVAVDRIGMLSDQDLIDFTLGGGGGYLLVECPYGAWPMELELHIGRLSALGIRPLLAHPERSAGVQAGDGIERVARAVDRGVLVQVTAGSLSGRFGGSAKKCARALLDAGLVHVLASDAHNVDRRPPRLAEAAQEVGDAELAHWLTDAAPLAVFNGEPLPQRPQQARRRFWSRR